MYLKYRAKYSKSLFMVFALMLFTVSALFLSRQTAYADTATLSNSTGIQGTVQGNPPTIPATISTPGNGQSFTTTPIKVSGLCTGDVLVKVFSNGVFVGSAQCKNGSYSLSIDLFEGKNDIVAESFDALNQQGPNSSTVSVTYNQPGYNANLPRVLLTTTYAKRGANPKETLTWPIILSGGTGPYAVSIDWGDGNTQLISLSSAGVFDINHTYAAPGVYIVIVKVTDNNGNSAFLQLVAVGNGALSQEALSSNGTSTIVTKVVVLWWPVAIAAVLVIISFWLGSRNKLVNLRKQAEKRIQY
jgi:hypothetical protein